MSRQRAIGPGPVEELGVGLEAPGHPHGPRRMRADVAPEMRPGGMAAGRDAGGVRPAETLLEMQDRALYPDKEEG